jgi:hypothetical protein
LQHAGLVRLARNVRFDPCDTAWVIVRRYQCISDLPAEDEEKPVNLPTIPSSTTDNFFRGSSHPTSLYNTPFRLPPINLCLLSFSNRVELRITLKSSATGLSPFKHGPEEDLIDLWLWQDEFGRAHVFLAMSSCLSFWYTRDMPRRSLVTSCAAFPDWESSDPRSLVYHNLVETVYVW